MAEAIQIHNQVYQYADQVDPEAERIKEYARDVSPLGAQKLSAQALGVLIHVMNQILRTNGAILKLQSEQLAMTRGLRDFVAQPQRSQVTLGDSRLSVGEAGE